MANRYWVGGTGNWDGTAGTKWSTTSGGAGGAAVPTSADDVFFDAASGANTVTISTGNTGAKSITCTGFTGTLAGTAAITVSGSVTLVAGMTMTYSGALTLNATATLTSAGKTLGSLVVDGVGITVTLGDALLLSSTITITRGTFTTANFNLTSTGLSSSNANTRTITLGSSTVTLTGSAPWSTQTTTNLTFNANTSQITMTATPAAFSGGGLTFYNVTNNANSSSATTISGANTFNNLTISATSASIKPLELSANQTVNGTLTVSGAAANTRIFVRSDGIGITRTITAAAVAATDTDFRDITIAGAAAPISPTRAGDCKGNSGITFPAAKTVYWNLGGGAVNWDANGWATGSGGSPAVNNFPLAQDTAVFDNTGTMPTTLQLNASWNVGTLDSSARTSAATLSFLSAFDGTFYGNLSFGTGITVSGVSGSVTVFAGRTTQTITSNGKSISFTIQIRSASGTVRLIDDLTYTSANNFDLFDGTLDLNGKTLSVSSAVVIQSGTKNITFNGGTIVLSNSGTAWNNAQPTGFTTTAGTGTGKISLTSASAKTFAGNGSTYNCTLSNDGAGALTISGSNTFTTLANAVQPTTFTFTSGTTQTVTNFSVSGTAGNLVTIGATTTSAATLSKASGTVNASYLSISYSTATGGATWNAANSVDGGNNTGWIITTALSTGNFFMLFN